MPSALLVDLRERVIEAIEAGSSRQHAAERFGVGKASAICWHARFRDAGEIAPKPAGGDRPPPVIEAHARRSWRSAASICRSSSGNCATPWPSTSGLWRFFGRHGFTRKKGLFTQTSSNAKT